MPFADVYLSLDGRLDRARWRLAVAALLVLTAGVFWVTGRLADRDLLAAPARDMTRLFVQVFVLVPWTALDWKRFQDQDRPGALALLCPALLVLSLLWGALPASLPGHGPVATLLAAGQLALGLWLAFALGLAPGTPGPNRHGAPNPTLALTTPRRRA